MRVYNEIRLRGYAGGDMKIGNGKRGDYATVSIGVSRGKDKETDWFNVYIAGKQLEWVDIRKGDLVEVKGRLSINNSEKYGKSITVFADPYGGVENISQWGQNDADRGTTSASEDDSDIPF